MFERFTDRARRVVVLAQEESRAYNHAYIGSEHLLLALVRDRDGLATKVLASLGVTSETVRQHVEETVVVGDEPASSHIPFTVDAKRVLEFALREAKDLGDGYIGTEHILLGLIREPDGLAGRVLAALEVDLERARAEVRRLASTAAEPHGTDRLSRLEHQVAMLSERLAAVERRLSD